MQIEALVKPTNRVTIRDLDHDEIEALLARNNVGRIAFSFHDRVDIRPIHYAYYDNWLYGRKIAPGAFRETDPVPFRTELFAIAIDRLTGRAASTA